MGFSPRVIGATTTTRSYPAARSALAGERMPPSIKRRPLMVTGGQTPGTAQLAPTASTRSTPLPESNVASSPVSTSTAVMSRFPVGQSWVPSRAATTARRSAAGSVRDRTAIRPSRIRALTGFRRAGATAQTNFAITRGPKLVTISPSAGASCVSYSSARVTPELILAATPAPADVPTTRSAAVRSTPRSASPASRPTSQAIPASPPAPSTSALLVIATVLPNRRPNGQEPPPPRRWPGRSPAAPGRPVTGGRAARPGAPPAAASRPGGNLPGVSVDVEVVREANDEVTAAMRHLLPQLSTSAAQPDQAAVQRIVGRRRPRCWPRSWTGRSSASSRWRCSRSRPVSVPGSRT